MSAIQYLLDEHVDPRLKTALKKIAPEIIVWRVGDPGAPALSAGDPDILVWCENNSFSLVTNNRASMPVHLQNHLAGGRHIPGIFILNLKLSVLETADELSLIWGASEAEEYADLIWYLPLSQ